MNRLIQIILIFSILFLVSCYNKPEPVTNKDLIPSKDLPDILTEMHLAGGVLSIPDISRRFAFKDSASNFNDITSKYGYTTEQLDNTIKYYFVKKPKQLQEIYDKVLTRLSEMESSIDTAVVKPPEIIQNLWVGKMTYALPENGTKEPVWFDIPVQDTGLYELKVSVMVYPDDKSINPGITVFFWKDDGTTDGVRDNWTRVSLPKDQILHHYTLSKRITDTTFTSIRGWLLDHDPQSGLWDKHMIAETILLTKVKPENIQVE